METASGSFEKGFRAGITALDMDPMCMRKKARANKLRGVTAQGYSAVEQDRVPGRVSGDDQTTLNRNS